MSLPTVWELHKTFGEEVADLIIDRGPLLLLGHVGSGSRALAREIGAQANVAAVLDSLTATGPEQLAARVVSELVARYQPLGPERLGEPTSEAARFRIQIARRYHDDAAAAVEIYSGAPAHGWNLARALGTPTETPLIVVLEAHRLARSTEVLWELRDLASRSQISLLLTSRPHQQDQLLGTQAPFFGDIQTLLMPQLTPQAWSHAFDDRIAPADLTWLLERTRGRTATTLETLTAWPAQRTPRDAWRYAARARVPHAEELLRVGGSVHEFAPRLLSAIAAGEAPYTAIDGARPNRIAKAIGLLHNLDLIEQPRPRRWQIADPLLGEALRVIEAGRRRLSILAPEFDGGE